VIKNLCLFHHVLTTIQLNFKNSEIKQIKGYTPIKTYHIGYSI